MIQSTRKTRHSVKDKKHDTRSRLDRFQQRSPTVSTPVFCRIAALSGDIVPKPGERKPAEMSQQERRAYFDDLNARRDKALVDLVGVLTDEQKAKFAEMKGPEPPFSLATRRLGSFSDRGRAPPKPSR